MSDVGYPAIEVCEGCWMSSEYCECPDDSGWGEFEEARITDVGLNSPFNNRGRKFHIVWSPQGAAPSVRHKQISEARNEAVRLAKENPGKEFIVLTADSSFQYAEMKATHFG